MSKWIDDQIVIDFPVPSSIRQIISELEKYDKEEDVYFYFDRSEWLENATKDYVYERVPHPANLRLPTASTLQT